MKGVYSASRKKKVTSTSDRCERGIQVTAETAEQEDEGQLDPVSFVSSVLPRNPKTHGLRWFSRKKITRTNDRREKGIQAVDPDEETESEEEHYAIPEMDKTTEEFRRDAKIWSLYLKEATEQANAQAELWKTGLEPLLLFAGLFAGVVTPFLIESRKKLQLEDQEFLLQDIRNALRNLPPPNPQNEYVPTQPMLWINGLWFLSLLLTLSSAIVGVLARSWLVKYTTPTRTIREESSDAYRRWMLDQTTRRSQMDSVITAIPLLVQLSFLLFAAGLGILAFIDNRTLGGMVLCAVGLSVVAALPLFLRTGFLPFRALLGHVQKPFMWLFGSIPVVLSFNIPDQRDSADVLAAIWYNLIKSPKPDHVDEAIAEITRRPLTSPRLRALATSDTPEIILRRLESCMDSNHRDLPKRNDIMSNNLFALSQFIAFSESIDHEDPGLRETLLRSLIPGRPLSTWNFFTEPVRPLAFAVRIPILLGFHQDVGEVEVDEQPWETLALSLQPKVRIGFLLSACRALVEGQENLKRVSSFSIVFCMASAVTSGYKIEWSGLLSPNSRKAAYALATGYMTRLFSEIANGWKEGPAKYLTDQILGGVPDHEYGIASPGLPESLAAALIHSKAKYRHQAALILVSLAEEEEDLYADAMRMIIPTLIGIAVSDDNDDVRRAATRALLALGTNGAYNGFLKDVLCRILEEKLCSYSQDLQQALNLLLSLSNNCGTSAFEDILKLTTVGLVETALREPDPEIQSSATRDLEVLVQQANTRMMLEDAIRNTLIADFRSESGLTRQGALNIVPRAVSLCSSFELELFKDESFQRAMRHAAATLVACAMGELDSDIRAAGRAAISLLLEKEPSDELRNGILSQLEEGLRCALINKHESIRMGALEFIRTHQDEPQFEEIIKDGLPRLSELILTDSIDEIRSAALSLFEELVVKVRFKPAVLAALSVDLNLYNGLGWRSRVHLIQLLEKLVLNADNEDGFQYIVRLAVSDDDMAVRDAGMKSLLALCESGSLSSDHIVQSLQAVLPQKIDITPGQGAKEAFGWAEVLFHLMGNESIRHTCCTIFQSSLGHRGENNHEEIAADEHTGGEDGEESVRSTGINRACSVLVTLSSRQDIQQSIRIAAVGTLHHMLHEQGIEPAWNSFKGLANDLLVDPNSDVALSYLTLLTTAASKYEFPEVVPKLVTILTGDPDAIELRRQSLEALEAFGRRESAAGAIIKALRPQLASISGSSWRIRATWAKILGTLANGAEFVDGVSQLVVMGIKDEDTDVRRTSLDALAELAGQPEKKHSDTILNATELSKNLDAISANTSWRERQAWASTLAALSKHATDFAFGRQKLIDLVVEDEDSDVRNKAYEGLSKLGEDPKGREAITSGLAKNFETALRDPHRDRRSRAVDNLRCDYFEPEFKFGDVLKILAGSLLKVALTDESDLVREAAVDLLTLMIGHQEIQRIGSAILAAIAGSIASFTERGKAVALRLVEALPNDLSDDVVSTTARTVTGLFKHNYSPTRTTALEILVILYKKGANVLSSSGLAMHFIQSNIPDIVSLALEDNNEDIRVIALNFLINLCDDSMFLSKIKTAQPRLMALMENRFLRPPTVELISLLSQDASVRRSVASWIISSVTNDANIQLEGIMELLSNLIIERRFAQDPQGSDYILLFLASALVLKPSMAKFRARLTTSLWCYYRGLGTWTTGDVTVRMPTSLIDWFMLSIFGRHVTSYELKAWMDMRRYIEPKEFKVSEKS